MRDIVREIGSKTEEGRLKIEKIERYEDSAEYYDKESLGSTIGTGVCLAITGLFACINAVVGNLIIARIISWLLTLGAGTVTAFIARNMVDDISSRNIYLDKARTLADEILELEDKEEKVK